MTERPPLMRHQAEGVAWGRRVGRGLLGDDPGTGKTRQLIEICDGGRTLVLAPAMVVAGGTWADEIAKWADHPELFTVVPYSQINLRKTTEKGGTTPTRGVRKEYRGTSRATHWDSLIMDEAHYTKGRGTAWAVGAYKISARADQVFPATGSPIPNWAHELYMPLKMIHRGKRGTEFGSFWRWAERWFDCTPTRFSNGFPVAGELLGCVPTLQDCLARPASNPCAHYRLFAEANLGDQYRRIVETDVLDLPPKREILVEVPLTAAARKLYRGLARDFIAQTGDGQQVVAWSRGELNVMLDRLTTSPWLVEDPALRKPTPHGGKLERLAFDLTASSGSVLVMAHYRDSVEACARVAQSLGRRVEFVHGGVSKAEAGRRIRAFKDGELDCLVGSLETLAEGQQFQVASTCIMVEESYKPYRNIQARRRVWRMGQTKPVRILTYVAPNTVDERKRKLLETKTDRQMRYLTAAEFVRLL